MSSSPSATVVQTVRIRADRLQQQLGEKEGTALKVCVFTPHSRNPKWYGWLSAKKTSCDVRFDPSDAGLRLDGSGARITQCGPLTFIVAAWMPVMSDSGYTVEACVGRGFLLSPTPAQGFPDGTWSTVTLRDVRNRAPFDVYMRCEPLRVARGGGGGGGGGEDGHAATIGGDAAPSDGDKPGRAEKAILGKPGDWDLDEIDLKNVLSREYDERATFNGFPVTDEVTAQSRTCMWSPVFPGAMSGRMTQVQLNQASFRLAPVWFQCLYIEDPRACAEFGQAAFTDRYFVSATRYALSVLGIADESAFVADPLAFPDVLSQVAQRFATSIPYVCDQDYKGQEAEHFSDPAVCRNFKVAAGDCEDFSKNMVHAMQVLFHRAWFSIESVWGGASGKADEWSDPGMAREHVELFRALLVLASCYVPFCVDTIVEQDRRGVLGSGKRVRMLHMRAKAVPLPLLVRLLHNGQAAHASVRSKPLECHAAALDFVETRTKRLQALEAGVSRGRASRLVSHLSLPVLNMESTDVSLSGEHHERDELSEVVGRSLAADQWRVPVAYAEIDEVSGPAEEVCWYSAVTGMCTGGQTFRFRPLQCSKSIGESGGEWTGGAMSPVGRNGFTSSKMPPRYTLRLSDRCALTAMRAPDSLEWCLARLYLATRELPQTVDVSGPLAPKNANRLPLRIPGRSVLVFSLHDTEAAVKKIRQRGAFVLDAYRVEIASGLWVDVLRVQPPPLIKR